MRTKVLVDVEHDDEVTPQQVVNWVNIATDALMKRREVKGLTVGRMLSEAERDLLFRRRPQKSAAEPLGVTLEYPEMTDQERALYWRNKIGQAVASGYPKIEEIIWQIMQMERRERKEAP